jgi:hypothetical protein
MGIRDERASPATPRREVERVLAPRARLSRLDRTGGVIPRPIGVLRFVNIFLAGLAAGTLTAMQVGLVPLARSLPEGTGLAVRRAFEGRIDHYEPVCVGLSAATAICLLVLGRGMTTRTRLVMAIGLAGSLAVGVTSLGWNNRIDHRMGPGSEGPLPPEYASLRQDWERGHLVRTVAGVAALGCYIVAGLLDRRPRDNAA